MQIRLLPLVAALLFAASPAVLAQDAARSHIVVLKAGPGDVRNEAAALVRSSGGQLGFVYEHALRGFSINASPQAARALARNPRVAYVVEDQLRSIQAQTVPTGIRRIFATGNPGIGIDGSDDFRVDVGVAVIDTGIDREHPDLNVVGGVSCAGGSPMRVSCKGNGDDDHYHGTHVAGTIGAVDNGSGVVGVAPGARLYAVKVLTSQGSGYTSWIVAGIDWVAARANVIQVANMSLGGTGFNQAEYDAIQGAVARGVAFAVSAGNAATDASSQSPASFNNVMTVSALADFDGLAGGFAASTCRSDQDDTLAGFSNYGPAVDIAAPGVCILSTFPLEQGGSGILSGTSMSAPHAAGALALLASKGFTRNEAGVRGLYQQVIDAGNNNWVDDSGDGIKEPLLDVSNTTLFKPVLIAGSGGGDDGGGGGGGGGEEPPPAGITLSATAAKTKGDRYANLSWSGAAATSVDVWRNGSKVTTTANDGQHTDGPLGKGGGSATYRICEAATTTCSNDVSVTW